MQEWLFGLLAKLVNNDMIAGWVRAAVAAGFVLLISKFPVFSFITPETQLNIAAAIAAFVVGLWSTISKSVSVPTVTETAKVVEAAKEAGVVSPTKAEEIKEAVAPAPIGAAGG